jgi:NMD protein affecting ribosome stability and mRNA decay
MNYYEKQEYEVKYSRAYSKKCIGCMRHKKSVMISMSNEKEEGIQDYFFTKEQAKRLFNELGRVLMENKVPFKDTETSHYFEGEPE